MERYGNGKIYRLLGDDGYFYIGSTCMPLHKRFFNHRAVGKYRNKQNTESRVYTHFNQLGWDHVKIYLIEEFACQTKQQLLCREAEEILKHQNDPKCLNVRVALVDPELRRVQRIEKRIEYRQQNPDVDTQARKKYWEKKKEEINKKRREKRAQQKILCSDIDGRRSEEGEEDVSRHAQGIEGTTEGARETS